MNDKKRLCMRRFARVWKRVREGEAEKEKGGRERGREIEIERDRQTDKQTDRQTEKDIFERDREIKAHIRIYIIIVRSKIYLFCL